MLYFFREILAKIYACVCMLQTISYLYQAYVCVFFLFGKRWTHATFFILRVCPHMRHVDFFGIDFCCRKKKERRNAKLAPHRLYLCIMYTYTKCIKYTRSSHEYLYNNCGTKINIGTHLCNGGNRD